MKSASPPPAHDPADRRFRFAAAAIVVLALAVRLLYLTEIRTLGFWDAPQSDARVYIDRARGIVTGDWLGPAEFVHAPLYAYFIAAIMRVVGPDPWWALRVIQSVLGAAACGLLAPTGRYWFDARIGLLAALLLALCPAAIFFDGLIQKTSLEIFLTTLLLACMAGAERRPALARFAAVGAVTGLLAMTRQHTLVVIPLLLVWAWRCRPAGRPRLAAAAACLVALVAVAAPWVVRNRIVLGEFALATPNMGQNFAMGNHAEATGTYYVFRRGYGSGIDEQREWTRAAEQAEGRRLTAREVSDHYLHRGLTWAREHPGDWLRLTIRKWLMVWNVGEICDTEDFYLYAERSALLRTLDRILHFGVLAPLAAAGIALTIRDWRRLWYLYGWLLLSAAATAVFVVFARYRAVLLPVLCLFAAAGVVGFMDVLRRRRRPNRLLGVAAIAVVLTAMLSNWRIYLPRRPQPISYCNHASALIEAGRFDDALDEAGRALALAPDDIEANVTAGDALSELNRFAEALEHYRRAGQGDPNFGRMLTGMGGALAGLDRLSEAEQTHRAALKLDESDRFARQGLATVAARQGRLEEAEKSFRALLIDHPDYCEAWINLGNTYQAMNRVDDAVAAYERAIAVRPRAVTAWYNLGVAETRRGRRERAIECFESVLRLDPRRSAAHRAIEMLQRSATQPSAP